MKCIVTVEAFTSTDKKASARRRAVNEIGPFVEILAGGGQFILEPNDAKKLYRILQSEGIDYGTQYDLSR